MSKIGNLPITIPGQVTTKIDKSQISVSGPKGNLGFQFRTEIEVKQEADKIIISRKSESKLAKSLHGLTRSIIANMVKGVTEGHVKVLEIVGTGYRAAKQEESLVLSVGYSHPVTITPLAGVSIETKENKIIVSGADKASVGEMAAIIRRVRSPEPYKGKGIKYSDEIIRRKVGKAVKAVGGPV